jgi:predicted MPP superfamily phosphohydrolase
LPLSRRQFLGTAIGLCGAGTTADAFLVEPRRVEVVRLDVTIPGLAPSLAGCRLVHVTDVHLHGGIHAAAGRVLEVLDREKPEVVVLTGDICERLRYLEDLTAFARGARGTLGTFATMGNWERYGGIGPADAARAYERAGVRLLLNEAAEVGSGAGRLQIVGLDDPVSGGPDPRAAWRQVAAGYPVLCLLHAPGFVDQPPMREVPPPALILAGHTHGGQIRLPLVPPLLPSGCGRFLAGWYHDAVGPLYVSRGIGTADIRARFRCAPELPILTLRPA